MEEVFEGHEEKGRWSDPEEVGRGQGNDALIFTPLLVRWAGTPLAFIFAFALPRGGFYLLVFLICT